MSLQEELQHFYKVHADKVKDILKGDFASTTFNLIKVACISSMGVRSPRAKKWLKDQIKGLENMPPELAEEYNLMYYVLNPDYKGILPPYAYTLASLREWQSADQGDKPANLKRRLQQLAITVLNLFKVEYSCTANSLGSDYLQIIFDQAGLHDQGKPYDASAAWLRYYDECVSDAFNPYSEANQLTQFLDNPANFETEI